MFSNYNKKFNILRHSLLLSTAILLISLGDARAQFSLQGVYKIKAYNSDQCLTVENRSKANGANVLLKPCSYEENQAWYLEQVSGSTSIYKIMSIYSEKCLDVKNASWQDHTNIQQNECNGTEAQKFEMHLVGPYDSFSIFTQIRPDNPSCLDITGGTARTNVNVQQYVCHFGDNQKWELEYLYSKAFNLCPINEAYPDEKNKCHGAYDMIKTRDGGFVIVGALRDCEYNKNYNVYDYKGKG